VVFLEMTIELETAIEPDWMLGLEAATEVA
jgi:hypothetical protein